MRPEQSEPTGDNTPVSDKKSVSGVATGRTGWALDWSIKSLNNEPDGPSDGTILLASCSDTGAIGTVSGSVTLGLNHIRLTWDTTAVAQIQTWLT